VLVRLCEPSDTFSTLTKVLSNEFHVAGFPSMSKSSVYWDLL